MGGLIDDRYAENFEIGTNLVFVQNSAPAGWTVRTESQYNAAGIRLVNIAAQGGGTGGSADAFTSHTHSVTHSHTMTGSTDGHAITVNEMPSHTHTINPATQAGGPTHNLGSGEATSNQPQVIQPTGGDAPHSHGLSGATVGNSSISNTGTFSPKYINAVVATKDP